MCGRSAHTDKTIRRLQASECLGKRMCAGQVVRDLGEGLGVGLGGPLVDRPLSSTIASSSVNGHVLLALGKYTFCKLCGACASTRRVINLARPCCGEPASQGQASWKLKRLLEGIKANSPGQERCRGCYKDIPETGYHQGHVVLQRSLAAL